jgi:hypothetical protein
VQGKTMLARNGGAAPIIQHPDVRRMLLMMKSKIQAARALYAEAGWWLDVARRGGTPEARAEAQGFVDLLTPLVKGWSTELGTEAASLGIQVFGGMGYIEETGAAQHYRDARIAQIYEGTNGIQANDLVFRKLLRDGGAVARAYIRRMRALDADLSAFGDEDMQSIRAEFSDALDRLREATDWLLDTGEAAPAKAAAGAFPYLMLFGTVAGGYMLARAALAAKGRLSRGEGHTEFLTAKLASARFYAEAVLSQARGMLAPVTKAWPAVIELDEAYF